MPSLQLPIINNSKGLVSSPVSKRKINGNGNGNGNGESSGRIRRRGGKHKSTSSSSTTTTTNAKGTITTRSARQIHSILKYVIVPILGTLLLLFQVQTFLLPHYYDYYYHNGGNHPSSPAAADNDIHIHPLLRLRQLHDSTENNKNASSSKTAALNAVSAGEILKALEQARLNGTDDYGNNITYSFAEDIEGDPNNNEGELLNQHQETESHRRKRSRRSHKRHRPHAKIVYLLHIHKSGGTAMCQMAKANQMSASEMNCNVQKDQRCCGHADTLHAQRQYATSNATQFDFVASEGRMYEAMDVTSYQYIMMLRNSQERYFSHWKHARRFYDSIPGSNVRHLDDSPEAAGGNARAGPVKNSRGKLVSFESQHHVETRNTMMDLVRENKQGRLEKRQQKMRDMEAWKQAAQEQADDQKKEQVVGSNPNQAQGQAQPNSINLDTKLDTKLDINKNLMGNSLQQQQERAIHVPSKPKEEDLEDFTIDAEENKDLFFPRRRLQEQRHWNDARHKKHGRDQNHERPHGIMPHPAEDPAHVQRFRESLDHFPVVGATFAEWWKLQPDNWNFRQLCGTHCIGIPKYQLTMKDWAYTLERYLQFDAVLFLEDMQTSVDALGKRLEWKQTNLVAMEAILKKEAQDRDIQIELQRRTKHHLNGTDEDTLLAWYHRNQEITKYHQEKDKLPEPPKEQMNENWEPLMTVLDDALYDIGKRWEALKLNTGKLSHQLSSNELVPIIDLRSLPESLRDYFHLYMEDEDGNHRYECTTECCSEEFCSAW